MANRGLISSVQNQRIKDALKLRDRRQRDKQQRIIIDGGRELLRAIEGDIAVAEVFLCQALVHGADSRRALELVEQSSADVWEVTEAVFEKLTYGDRGDGLIAVGAIRARSLDQLVTPPGALVAVLEGIEKPGNVGAILRSADAAGVAAVLVADPRTDLYNPNCIRASMGTVFTLPVAVTTSGEARQWLQQRGFRVHAARVDGAIDYTAVDFTGATAIVLGSEAEGLSDAWSGDGIKAIRLPMLGKADSLNVSVTAAVLFYEALRQRGAPPTA
jgi:TrmH family RNA methyltransferase